MDSPTLSTVQSLGILSGVEALLTRDARGWLYSGRHERSGPILVNSLIELTV